MIKSTIPQLTLNSLFEPALLHKQQSLDSNQKQLSRFIKKFINIESLKFIDFDYLEKYKEDVNNTNTDIYDNFIDKATKHLEKGFTMMILIPKKTNSQRL